MTYEIEPMELDEIIEVVKDEDTMYQTGVGALVRIALGVEEPEIYAQAAAQMGYREFHLLARIFASFGTTVLANRYDALLTALEDAGVEA